jgi:cell division protein FtsI/penicillin-binding protein 2
LVSAATAARVRRALLATVRRGTASGVRPLLAGAGWQLGGKTGTAPGRDPGRPDGWFAGLMFDARGAARYTVVVHVRGGGAGGGAAARVAAALTRAAAREADG